MTAFRRFSAIPAIAALVFSVSGSFAAAQGTWTVLSQYQYAVSTGTTQGWYQYAPATVASSGLALLDTSTATYSQYFTGTAQAFGVYFGQAASNIGFRVRGFEVIYAVPEPATVGLTALGLGSLVATRMVRRRLRRRS